jgi:hypothetical protein
VNFNKRIEGRKSYMVNNDISEITEFYRVNTEEDNIDDYSYCVDCYSISGPNSVREAFTSFNLPSIYDDDDEFVEYD